MTSGGVVAMPKGIFGPKPRKSSYNIFMSYVSIKDNGECDTSGIFSVECYREWLDSRSQRPQNPEISYRSSLLVHVTGSNHTRPFPYIVEGSVLKRLRQKKVWECFRNTEIKIGIQGFRGKAYHEDVSSDNECDAMSVESEGGKLALSLPIDCLDYDLVEILLEASFELFGSVSKKRKRVLYIKCEEENEILIRRTKKELVNLARNPFTLAGKFAYVLMKHYGRGRIEEFVRKLIHQQVDFLGPTLYHSLKQNVSDNLRLEPGFLFPTNPSFDPFVPSGYVTLDQYFNIMQVHGNVAKSFFDAPGSPKNMIAFSSPLEAALLLKTGLSIIQEKGEVWIHHIVYYGSGQSVLLEHCRLNGNSYEIEMQDVTDNYRCILDLPILV
mmetsp:Transcript_15589/g.20007  ORF Transcript_15589/g.20007 Transcript_15589/m.20007 type:complete len:383 (-) Transcript_15589:678-1826(-)